MRTVGLTRGVRKEALHDCTTSVGTTFAQLVQLRKQGDRDNVEKTSREDKQRRQEEKTSREDKQRRQAEKTSREEGQ